MNIEDDSCVTNIFNFRLDITYNSNFDTECM